MNLNFPDAVWIFESSHSIDGVDRIPASRALNCADTVRTFLSARERANGSSQNWPDTVWLFLHLLLALDSTGKMPVGPTGKMAVLRKRKLFMRVLIAGEFHRVPS
jgi:hypothetical protein